MIKSTEKEELMPSLHRQKKHRNAVGRQRHSFSGLEYVRTVQNLDLRLIKGEAY